MSRLYDSVRINEPMGMQPSKIHIYITHHLFNSVQYLYLIHVMNGEERKWNSTSLDTWPDVVQRHGQLTRQYCIRVFYRYIVT